MMRRYCVNLSDEAAKVWFAHQAKTGLKRDPAIDALLLEFGGLYELPALYPVALNADWSNIFYCCIPILDKSMHIHGAGQGKTVLKLAAWQQKQLPGGAPSPLLADASVPPIPSLSKVLSSLKDAPVPGRRPLCNHL